MNGKEYLQYLIRSTQLRLLDEAGLENRAKTDVPVIVSFTSIPSRFKRLHLTVRNLLSQSVNAKRIVLWLNQSLKNTLPRQLIRLEGDRFEIRYSPLDCSHMKLVHCLEHFPDDHIVTCDDDLIYYPRWLEYLWQEHMNTPHQIVANQCNLISYSDDGSTLPYRQWEKKVKPGHMPSRSYARGLWWRFISTPFALGNGDGRFTLFKAGPQSGRSLV